MQDLQKHYYDVISYHCVSKLAYFVEHNIGYHSSKFQCSRMSGSNFMECYNEIKKPSAYRVNLSSLFQLFLLFQLFHFLKWNRWNSLPVLSIPKKVTFPFTTTSDAFVILWPLALTPYGPIFLFRELWEIDKISHFYFEIKRGISIFFSSSKTGSFLD